MTVSTPPSDLALARGLSRAQSSAGRSAVQPAPKVQIDLKDGEYLLDVDGSFQVSIGKGYADYSDTEKLLLICTIVGTVVQAFRWHVRREG